MIIFNLNPVWPLLGSHVVFVATLKFRDLSSCSEWTLEKYFCYDSFLTHFLLDINVFLVEKI